jgi:predicted ribosome quality control (RQC) complex YloA/Tae2 family protein
MGSTQNNKRKDDLFADPVAEESKILAAKARKRLSKLIQKKNRLLENLEMDLRKHGDASAWRRFGDLILANIHSAEPRDGSIVVVDYFDETMPTLSIPVDAGQSPMKAAEQYYRRAARAKKAAGEIAKRMDITQGAIRDAEAKMRRIDDAERAMDVELLRAFAEPPRQVVRSKPLKIKTDEKRYRRFVSSDGYEIFVGRSAADNDYLTFRVSNSLDIWLHAADHPGSHVIVRLPKGEQIPPQTLKEAAQLAGFYSSGRQQPKLEVRYTHRKFVHKPKSVKPGVVSLSKFKSILVEPKIPFERENGA